MPDTTELLDHYYLTIGGQAPRAELLANVAEIVVESSLHLPDVATITLSYTFFEVGGTVPAAPQPTAAAPQEDSSKVRL